MCIAPSPAACLKRINELRAHVRNSNDPNAYFQDFENSLRDIAPKRKVFFDWEAELQLLDDEAWEHLIAEAIPRLTQRHPTRGWEALFNILNQAKAYNFLKRRHLGGVRFIPRAAGKTPDLEARSGNAFVLCEVKTLNISKIEADRRATHDAGTTVLWLNDGIFNKLQSDIDTAVAQMRAHDTSGTAQMVFYCIVNFDDHLHECADEYRPQLDAYVQANVDPALEVVFNIKPPFYSAKS